ncbi:hypothetical protein IP70_06225 [alpha proteobacterium AAP38]|nr:hypothetical protein IP70_06225 [alpha proteobacterium AAP38]
MPRHLLVRHESRHPHLAAHVKAGVGATVTIAAAGWLAGVTHLPLLLAPFGASAVLLFAQAASPLAQPVNVIGGYLLAGLVTLLAHMALPADWWVVGLTVGAAITMMSLARLTHPPAGAMPVVVAGSTTMPALELLAIAVAGAAVMTIYAALHHRLPPRFDYPKRPAPMVS